MYALAVAAGVIAVRRLRRAHRPRLAGLGLSWSRLSSADAAAGIAIGAAVMGGIALIEAALGGIGLVVGDGAGGLLPEAIVRLAHAIVEEAVFRGGLITGLLVLLPKRPVVAIAVSALVFGLSHAANPGASPISLLGLTLGGAVYALAFLGSRAIWLPLGVHFAWNVVQGPVLGFPVSGLPGSGVFRVLDHGPAWLTGGGYGPEAGLIGILARGAALAGVLAWLRWRARRALPD